MKKILICLIACLFTGASSATLITNGSFESGNFDGWTQEDLSSPFFPLQVNGSGITSGFGLFSSAPTDGSFAALNGFDGNGPGTISLSQEITVTSLSTIMFDYRAGWDMFNFPASTQDRLFDVNINSLGGSNLASYNILSATANSQNLDTGNMTGHIDLNSFIGQTVNISFDWSIPEEFTGPAFFQLDNVRSVAVSSVPEPETIVMLTLGLTGLLVSRKKKAV